MIKFIIIFSLGFAAGWVSMWSQQFLSHVAQKAIEDEMDERRRRDKEEQEI